MAILMILCIIILIAIIINIVLTMQKSISVDTEKKSRENY